jgi:co-chaperonin GroES (HSP10)
MNKKNLSQFNLKEINIKPDCCLVWIFDIPPPRTSGGIIVTSEQRENVAFYSTVGILAKKGKNFSWNEHEIPVGSLVFFKAHTGVMMLSEKDNYFRLIDDASSNILGWQKWDIKNEQPILEDNNDRQ